MTAEQQCCESYLTFIGKVADRDTVQCTEYDVNIQDIRSNILANISRSNVNFNYSYLRFKQIRVLTDSEPVPDFQTGKLCGKQPAIKYTARLQFSNVRLDPIQLGMQCSGCYPHTTLLELVSPTGEKMYGKTFIMC